MQQTRQLMIPTTVSADCNPITYTLTRKDGTSLPADIQIIGDISDLKVQYTFSDPMTIRATEEIVMTYYLDDTVLKTYDKTISFTKCTADLSGSLFTSTGSTIGNVAKSTATETEKTLFIKKPVYDLDSDIDECALQASIAIGPSYATLTDDQLKITLPADLATEPDQTIDFEWKFVTNSTTTVVHTEQGTLKFGDCSDYGKAGINVLGSGGYRWVDMDTKSDPSDFDWCYEHDPLAIVDGVYVWDKMKYEASNSKCPRQRRIKLAAHTVNAICGPLTFTPNLDPLPTGVSWDDSTDDKHWKIDFDAMWNGQTSLNEIDHVLTVKVKAGDHAAYGEPSLNLQTHACDRANNDLTTPDYVYNLNSGAPLNLHMRSNSRISYRCRAGFSFDMDGVDVSTLPFFSINEGLDGQERPNYTLNITHPDQMSIANIREGGSTITRTQRGHSLSFKLLICYLNLPAQSLVLIEDVHIPPTGSKTGFITVTELEMLPIDQGTQTCPSFTPRLEQVNTISATLAFVSTDAVTKTTKYSISVPSTQADVDAVFQLKAEIDGVKFDGNNIDVPLYGCVEPVFSGDSIDLTHNPLVWWDPASTMYVLDLANAAGVDRQVKITLTDADPTCFTYTHAFTNSDQDWASGIEWKTDKVFELTFPVGSFDEATQEGLSIKFIATRASGLGTPGHKWINFIIKDCSKESITALPTALPAVYMNINDAAQTFSLAKTAWPFPEMKAKGCAAYYFGLEVTDSQGTTVKVGGHPDDVVSVPTWLKDWKQNTFYGNTEDTYFSFNIEPPAPELLQQFVITIRVSNKDGYQFKDDTKTTKVQFFQIDMKDMVDMFTFAASADDGFNRYDAVNNVYQTIKAPPNGRIDGGDIKRSFIVITQPKSPKQIYASPDLKFTMKFLNEDNTEYTGYDYPLNITPNQFVLEPTLIDWVSDTREYTQKFSGWLVITDGTLQRHQVLASTHTWKIFDVEIKVFDCTQMIENKPQPLLSLVSDLANERSITKDGDENYHFVIDTKDAIKIYIKAVTNNDPTESLICGPITYGVEHDGSTDLADFLSHTPRTDDTAERIIVNTIGMPLTGGDKTEINVKAYAYNTFHKHLIIESKFTWHSCEDKVVTHKPLSDVAASTWLDYSKDPVEETNTVLTFDEFTFDNDPYCFVNQYIFKVTKPDEVTLCRMSYTDRGLVYQEPDDDDCKRFTLDKFDLTQREISVSKDNFTSFQEGKWTLQLGGRMKLEGEKYSAQGISVIHRTIQAYCLDKANNPVTVIKDTVLKDRVINLTLGSRAQIEYQDLDDPAFGWVFKHTCKVAYFIQNAARTAAPAYITVVEADRTIKIGATTNDDFPADSLDDRPSVTKDFFLKANIDGSTDPNQGASIPFKVKYTLNCSKAVVALAEIDQTDSPATTTQSPSHIEEIQPKRATFVDKKDEKCALSYKLVQQGYNNTVANPTYNAATDGDYDTSLVMLDVIESPDVVKLRTQIHNMNPVYTYALDGSKCDLQDVSTKSCVQIFDVYVYSYTGIIAKLVSMPVTINSECVDIAVRYAAADALTKATFWTWSTEHKTTYLKGQRVRDPMHKFTLPEFTPTLASGKDFATECGTVTYDVTNPEAEIFGNVLPVSAVSNTAPTFEAFTDSPYHTLLVEPFSKDYLFGLKVTLDAYSEEFVYPDEMPFPVHDPCLGVTHAREQYITQYNAQDVVQDAPVQNLNLFNTIQNVPAYFKFQLNNHKFKADDPDWHNDCGYSIYDIEWLMNEDDIKPSPEQIFTLTELDGVKQGKFDPPLYQLYATENAEIGTYEVLIHVRDSIVNITEIKETFNFTIEIEPCQTTQVWTNSFFKPLFLYQEQEPPVRILLPEFHQHPACNYTWSYHVFELLSTIKDDGTHDPLVSLEQAQSLPQVETSIVKSTNFISEQKWLQLQEMNLDTAGNLYSIYFTGQLGYHGDDDASVSQKKLFVATTPIDVEIGMPYHLVFNSLPTFDFIESELKLLPGESYGVQFEDPGDKEENIVFVKSFKLNPATGDHVDWVTYLNETQFEANSFEIKIPDDYLNKVDYNFKVEIVFSDDHLNEKLDFEKIIQVRIPSDAPEEEVVEDESAFDPLTLLSRNKAKQVREQNLPPPTVEIQLIDNSYFSIQFNQPVYFKKPKAAQARRRLQEGESDDKRFNLEELENLTPENGGDEIFTFTYQPSDTTQDILDGEGKSVEMTWSIKVTDSTGFQVIPAFDQPTLVSIDENNKDSMSLEILTLDNFVGYTGKPADISSLEETTLIVELPRLETQSFEKPEQVKLLKDTFAQTIKSIMAGNFFLSLILATALQYLWGMVNAFQLIVLGVFFSLLMPPNTAIVQIEILKACSFDLFHTEVFYNQVFHFMETPSFSDAFENAGIEGSNFVLGIGPVFIFVCIFPIYFLVHKFMRWLFKGEQKNKCIKKFIKPKGFLQIAMIFMLEGCIELGMTCGVCLMMLDEDRYSNGVEAFSTGLCFFFCAALVVAPIYLMFVGVDLYYARHERNKPVVRKYRDLFTGLKTKKALAIQYNTLFFLRRYSLMAVIVFLPDGRFTQVNISFFFTFFVLVILLDVKPFIEKAQNYQEVINELTVLISNYFCFCYTEWVWLFETRYLIGWLQILLILLNLLINTSFMLVISGHDLKLRCKKRMNLKKAQKRSKDRQDAAEEKARLQQEEANRVAAEKNAIHNMFPQVGPLYIADDGDSDYSDENQDSAAKLSLQSIQEEVNEDEDEESKQVGVPQIKDGKIDESQLLAQRNVDSLEQIVKNELEISSSLDDINHLEQMRSGVIPNPLRNLAQNEFESFIQAQKENQPQIASTDALPAINVAKKPKRKFKKRKKGKKQPVANQAANTAGPHEADQQMTFQGSQSIEAVFQQNKQIRSQTELDRQGNLDRNFDQIMRDVRDRDYPQLALPSDTLHKHGYIPMGISNQPVRIEPVNFMANPYALKEENGLVASFLKLNNESSEGQPPSAKKIQDRQSLQRAQDDAYLAQTMQEPPKVRKNNSPQNSERNLVTNRDDRVMTRGKPAPLIQANSLGDLPMHMQPNQMRANAQNDTGLTMRRDLSYDPNNRKPHQPQAMAGYQYQPNYNRNQFTKD